MNKSLTGCPNCDVLHARGYYGRCAVCEELSKLMAAEVLALATATMPSRSEARAEREARQRGLVRSPVRSRP